MHSSVAGSERQLRAAGIRVTSQRSLILEVLSRPAGHLDANEIFEQARRQDARLSLSTVYRTLSLLKEAGVVNELHLDSEHHHYELDSKGDHSHLICMGCGTVIEVDSAAFGEAARSVGESHDFEVASTQVELAGYCAVCRSSRSGLPA